MSSDRTNSPALPQPTPAAAEPARVAAIVAGPPLVAAAVVVVVELAGAIELGIIALGVATSVAATLRLVVSPLVASWHRARTDAMNAELELVAEHRDRDFRDRLERALRISEAEPATLRTGMRAVAELAPDSDVSLLLNVPDEPRVGWRIRLADGALESAVPIEDTPTCVALSDGATAVTASSGSLEACAHLHDPHVEVSSVCVPLRLGERMLGSVCVQGPPGERPDERTLGQIEWAVERTGVRAAEQRMARGPSLSGPTDPVTGLPGPATLKNHLRDLVRSLAPFCVAIVDIDGFGLLIDDDEGDDSLHLLAEVLCATLRPDDLVCRLEGARFAAVLSQCSADQAISALERAREALVLTVAETEHAPFTCSSGVVESHRATSLDQLVELASEACVAARRAGGNRVMVSGAEQSAPH